MSKWKFSMSKAVLEDKIERLRLEKGDILVVKDFEVLKSLEWIGPKLSLDFHVPMVFAPTGVQTLKKEDLLNLLEQLEQTDKSVLPEYHITEQPSAPL